MTIVVFVDIFFEVRIHFDDHCFYEEFKDSDKIFVIKFSLQTAKREREKKINPKISRVTQFTTNIHGKASFIKFYIFIFYNEKASFITCNFLYIHEKASFVNFYILDRGKFLSHDYSLGNFIFLREN